jgi:hypothetical protein
MSPARRDGEDRMEAIWTNLEDLEGADATSDHPEDRAHWMAVYAELVDTTDRMLVSARERLVALDGNGSAEAASEAREVEMLASRTAFLKERLRWWTARGRKGSRGNGARPLN